MSKGKWYRIKENGWYVIVSSDGKIKMYGWPTEEESQQMLDFMNGD